MWILALGIVMCDGNTRRDCRCEATFERVEPFFALAAKPVRTFDGVLLEAKMDTYARISAGGGGGS